jgi:hypothetical protein
MPLPTKSRSIRIRYLIVILLAVFLAACKKQPVEQVIELEPRFPGDLYLVKVTKKAGIRVFINKIEVKNKGIIDRFISGEQNFGVQTQDLASDEKIRFISPDTASMENRASKLVVTRNGEQYLFRSINKNYITSEYFRLIGKMNKHRSELGAPRYDGKYQVDFLMAGYGSYAKIEMPVYNYKLVKAHKVDDYFGWGEYMFRSVNTGKVFNEFDETYINSLTQTDTLAVEEYAYTFMLR